MTRRGLYSLAGVVLAVDQISKHWVVGTYRTWPTDGYGYSRPIIPGFFSFTYAQNTGGAFSILQSNTLLLAAASAVAAAAILVYTLRARSPLPGLLAVALGGALGGALGNLLDRLRLHYVVDFLDLHAGTHYQWPIFNVADSAICVGVGLLAIHYARAPSRATHPAPAPK